MSDETYVTWTSDEMTPSCVTCGLRFVEGDRTEWVYGNVGIFVMAHRLCPADEDRLQMAVNDAARRD